jgi:excisionase family DNA binding protein
MNKKEAADRLNVSTRLVEKYAGEGRLGEVKYVRGRTGKQADYEPEAVERLKAELESPAYSLAPTAPGMNAALVGVLERIAASLDSRPALPAGSHEQTGGATGSGDGSKPTVAVADKILLTLADASALTSLSAGHLRDAIHNGKLKAKIVGRGWKVKRADLDGYIKRL